MKKKIYLLSTILLVCSSTFAQSIVPEDNDPNDTLINEVEFRAKVNEQLYNHIDSCKTPLLTGISVIKFEDYVNIYVPHNNNNSYFTENTFAIYNEDGNLLSNDYHLNEESLLIRELPLNNIYSFKSVDYCGNLIDIATINTYQNLDSINNEQIVVSSELMQILSNIDNNNNNLENIYELIVSAPNISYFEKMAFIQNYYMEGEPYSSVLDISQNLNIGDIEYSSQIEDFIQLSELEELFSRNGSGCNCKVIMTLEVGKRNDGNINLSQANVSPTYPTGNNNVIYDMNEKYYKLWHSYSRMGASRYEQVWQRGKNSVPREWIMNDYDATFQIKPPHLSQISYNLLCTKMNNEIPVCECEKKLDIEYEYISTVSTKIEDVKRSSEVQALARDFAMLVIDDNINPVIVESNMIAVAQSYSQELNFKELMSGIGDIVKGAIKATRWGKKQTEAGISMIVDGIINSIDATKRIKQMEGHLGTADNTGILLDGIKTINLTSNQVTNITMYSASALHTKGKKYWFSEAKALSGYHLSTFIPCGTREEEGNCYESGAASWMAGSVATPQEHQSFIDDARNFYFLRGYNNFNNKEIGIINTICRSFDFNVRPLSNIELIDTNLIGPFHYSIINLIGQEIKQGNYEFNEFNLINFKSQLNLPNNGIYILRLKDINGTIKNIKFLHQ